jgi:hypothetical protein
MASADVARLVSCRGRGTFACRWRRLAQLTRAGAPHRSTARAPDFFAGEVLQSEYGDSFAWWRSVCPARPSSRSAAGRGTASAAAATVGADLRERLRPDPQRLRAGCPSSPPVRPASSQTPALLRAGLGEDDAPPKAIGGRLAPARRAQQRSRRRHQVHEQVTLRRQWEVQALRTPACASNRRPSARQVERLQRGDVRRPAFAIGKEETGSSSWRRHASISGIPALDGWR